MSDIKWIKIVTDIFDDEKMYAIECMPDGRDIELVWFKILCLAGKCNQNGFLIINDKLAYTDEMLSKIFRMEIGVVQRALETFQTLQMIEVVDDSYMVSNWLMYQSGDRMEEVKEKNRIRQQRYRDNQKAKLLEMKKVRNVTNNVTNNVTPSISISNTLNSNSLSNDIDTNKYKSIKHKYGEYKNVLLTDEQYQKLTEEFPNDYQRRIEEVSEYCASHGKTYKNYLATIRNWARKEGNNGQRNQGVSNADEEQREKELDNFVDRLLSGEEDDGYNPFR